MIILVGWSPLPPGLTGFAAVGASLLAAFLYAVAGIYARGVFGGITPLRLAIGQQLGATLILAPVAVPVGIVTAPALQPTPGVLAALGALAIFCTAVAYLLYFFLLTSVGPTKTLSVTFLVPVFGLLWSALFLREPLTLGLFAGLCLILASIILVTGLRPRLALPGTRRASPPA